MATLSTPEDALPLLAYKIAPRQFDLSYRFSNISLRDQIVRAQTLVRTLVDTGLLKRNSDKVKREPRKRKFQLLICGAGAAGLAAAKEAAALGITFVLVEKEEHVPGGILRSDAQRYVSTAMYEWPHPNHTHHDFPLAYPHLLGAERARSSLPLSFDKPVLIKEFGSAIATELATDIREWDENYTNFTRGGYLRPDCLLIRNAHLSKRTKDALSSMLKGKVSIHGVPLHNQHLPRIRLESPTGVPIAGFTFDYVIYAVGFAPEAVTYAGKKRPFASFKDTAFWKKDLVSNRQLGFSDIKPHVVILGSGDGALQDALRCLVLKKYPHPLAIWDGLMAHSQPSGTKLLDSSHVHHAMARVTAADSYTTSGAIWNHQTHVFHSLDDAFRKIVDDLLRHEAPKLRNALSAMLRDDVKQVSVVTQHGYFSKAYALNRFLILLFHALLATTSKAGSVKLALLSGTVTGFKKIGSNRRGALVTVTHPHGKPTVMAGDLVIIRGGLDRDKSPTQLVGLSGQDTGRAGLGRIPAPIRPIALSDKP